MRKLWWMIAVVFLFGSLVSPIVWADTVITNAAGQATAIEGFAINANGFEFTYNVTFGSTFSPTVFLNLGGATFAEVVGQVDKDLGTLPVAGFDPCCFHTDHVGMAFGNTVYFASNDEPGTFPWFCEGCEIVPLSGGIFVVNNFPDTFSAVDFTLVSTTAPEPSTATLMLSGMLLGFLAVLRKRNVPRLARATETHRTQ